jgi:Rrf2 family transcriptional regulator, nitric oxide-sensitive transcriptional repressor
MRLTQYTDYAMRVLLYLGARPDQMCSIAAIAAAYGVSQNHLMKVVSNLARAGFVHSARGRAGGIRLARPPAEINVGAVVRQMESDLNLVDCSRCPIASACGLTCVLKEAVAAFLAVLDRYSLGDLLERRPGLATLLKLDAAG